jgi:hypothetical protein
MNAIGASQRYMLVTVQRHREWILARYPGVRGARMELFESVRFTSLEEGNREIERRRQLEAARPGACG